MIRPIIFNGVDEIHEYASDKNITIMLFLPKETIDETKELVNYAVDEWNKNICILLLSWNMSK